MSIRELSTSEFSQVSGGNSCDTMYKNMQAMATVLEIAKLYEKYDPRYSGMDCHVVVATDPGLRRGMMVIFTNLGYNAEKSMDMWLKDKY